MRDGEARASAVGIERSRKTQPSLRPNRSTLTVPGSIPITADARYGYYNDKIVRQFAVTTILWGIVGMAVGVLIAAQLYWPTIGEGIPWLSYGRLRGLPG